MRTGRGVYKLRALLVFLLLAFPFAESASGADNRFEFGIDAGVRVDELGWHIAGDINGENPNILSELTWKDMKFDYLQQRFDAKLTNDGLIRLKERLGYGRVRSGKNRDSDYDGDNRTLEFSRSDNGVTGSRVADASVALGICITPATGGNEFIPYVGYSANVQNMRMTDGYQTVNPGGFTGPFPGLDSKYDARWRGPWAGFDFLVNAGKNLRITGSFEYHFKVDYHAEADWNLREEFAHPVSYEHDSKGHGASISLGGLYELDENASLNITFGWRKFDAGSGTDTVYFVDGSEAMTQLNEVKWESKSLLAGFTLAF
ncbi:MAG: hypothetical protein HZA20_07220 [Nitrospirae bacterium]|nr:hypothetical protein [Nitrospirota bacterium]